MLIEAFRIEGRRGQVLTIPRSCASVHCEPCQGLTAAALSRSYVVPRGSFGGDNYPCTASIRTVGIRCTALENHALRNEGLFSFIKNTIRGLKATDQRNRRVKSIDYKLVIFRGFWIVQIKNTSANPFTL